jgi:hypothetical protein
MREEEIGVIALQDAVLPCSATSNLIPYLLPWLCVMIHRSSRLTCLSTCLTLACSDYGPSIHHHTDTYASVRLSTRIPGPYTVARLKVPRIGRSLQPIFNVTCNIHVLPCSRQPKKSPSEPRNRHVPVTGEFRAVEIKTRGRRHHRFERTMKCWRANIVVNYVSAKQTLFISS